MRWHSQDGFNIEAILNTSSQLPRDKLDFGKVQIISNKYRSSLKMKLNGFDWAIAPEVVLFEREDIGSIPLLQ